MNEYVEVILIVIITCCLTLFIMKVSDDPIRLCGTTYELDCKANSSVNGYYNGVGFFVVTKDRTSEEIAETTFHELSHYYADKDNKHFCGD